MLSLSTFWLNVYPAGHHQPQKCLKDEKKQGQFFDSKLYMGGQ